MFWDMPTELHPPPAHNQLHQRDDDVNTSSVISKNTGTNSTMTNVIHSHHCDIFIRQKHLPYLQEQAELWPLECILGNIVPPSIFSSFDLKTILLHYIQKIDSRGDNKDS